jgi:TIR domain
MSTESAGIPVWRDITSVWAGQDWRVEVRRAINSDALAFIACFSHNSESRTVSYQNEELVLAIEQLRLRRPGAQWLIPVRLDECEIPDLDIGAGRTLRSIQRADVFGRQRDRALTTLVGSVRRILALPVEG